MTTPSERSVGSARPRSARPSGSARARLLARTDLVGPELRAGLTAMFDSWLSRLLPPTPGVALLAVGGLGRREPTPYGDLDLVLLHDGKVAELSSVADSLWYPIWDSGVGLDHSVRTPQQALAVAADDLKALLGMLDARHIAGDPALTGLVREQAISRWRRSAPAQVAQLQELARGRWRSRGDASFLLEPDLKDCRGGLRDWVGLRALASAQLLDLTPAVLQAGTVLLDVRGELHRLAGHSADVLRAQDRDSVARALGLPGPDEVLRAVHEAARTLAYATDAAWRRVAGAERRASRSLLSRLRPASARPAAWPGAAGRPGAAGQGRGGPGRRGGAGPRRRPVGRSGADAAGGPGGSGGGPADLGLRPEPAGHRGRPAARALAGRGPRGVRGAAGGSAPGRCRRWRRWTSTAC